MTMNGAIVHQMVTLTIFAMMGKDSVHQQGFVKQIVKIHVKNEELILNKLYCLVLFDFLHLMLIIMLLYI